MNFFAYYKEVRYGGRVERFQEKEIKVENFKKLANQMLVVPFTIKDEVHKKTYLMKYKVGFIGCDQNPKKEVFPVQGWLVSPSTKEDREEDRKEDRKEDKDIEGDDDLDELFKELFE